MRKDPDRLAELRRQLILDTSIEKAYDDITKLMSESLDVPIAMINFMDVDRNWSKSNVGCPLTESSVETSFCESFFNSDTDVIVVPDTLESGTVQPASTCNWRAASPLLCLSPPGCEWSDFGHAVCF